MSYSKTYTGTVHYSGSESYSRSYPASEHGGTVSGTVHYSGSVPVSINLYVDTDPFDDSVSDCASSVKKLNNAVVSMNAAQVASINKSANEVARHVVGGFFNMVSAELSQNMAALVAKFKAVFELLTSRSATLEKQQLVMQDDYTRIASRYNTFFKNLDEELEKRVVALDKNVFELSKRVQSEQLYSDTAKKVSQFLLGVNEDEIVQQQLLIASTKAKVLAAMDALSANVLQEHAYSEKVNSSLSEKTCASGQKNYIPVIFTESVNLNSDMVDYTCISNPLSAACTDSIAEAVKNYFVSNSAPQFPSDGTEAKFVDEAFELLAERTFQDLKDEKSIRVYETLKKLKES